MGVTNILLGTLALASLSHATLDYERYRLIDHKPHGNTTNYFFRSNEPVEDGVFGYEKILNYTKTRLAEANLTLHEPVYIVDINLLEDVFAEAEQIKIEKEYFAANPKQGRVWRHPIVGNLINPSVFPEWLIKLALKVYEHVNWD